MDTEEDDWSRVHSIHAWTYLSSADSLHGPVAMLDPVKVWPVLHSTHISLGIP